jgi:hypothetical protein
VNSNPSLRIDFDKENEMGTIERRRMDRKKSVLRFSFPGKIVYQSSPIDEEIKKPLVLETLKLALPKKKLDTM